MNPLNSFSLFIITFALIVNNLVNFSTISTNWLFENTLRDITDVCLVNIGRHGKYFTREGAGIPRSQNEKKSISLLSNILKNCVGKTFQSEIVNNVRFTETKYIITTERIVINNEGNSQKKTDTYSDIRWETFIPGKLKVETENSELVKASLFFEQACKHKKSVVTKGSKQIVQHYTNEILMFIPKGRFKDFQKTVNDLLNEKSARK